MQESVLNRTESTLRAIALSSIDECQKDHLRAIICQARDGTNGLSAEEKIQSNSEVLFSLAWMLVTQIITSEHEKKNQKPTTWKDVVSRHPWPITIILVTFLICGAYVINKHPEIAAEAAHTYQTTHQQ